MKTERVKIFKKRLPWLNGLAKGAEYATSRIQDELFEQRPGGFGDLIRRDRIIVFDEAGTIVAEVKRPWPVLSFLVAIGNETLRQRLERLPEARLARARFIVKVNYRGLGAAPFVTIFSPKRGETVARLWEKFLKMERTKANDEIDGVLNELP